MKPGGVGVIHGLSGIIRMSTTTVVFLLLGVDKCPSQLEDPYLVLLSWPTIISIFNFIGKFLFRRYLNGYVVSIVSSRYLVILEESNLRERLWVCHNSSEISQGAFPLRFHSTNFFSGFFIISWILLSDLGFFVKVHLDLIHMIDSTYYYTILIIIITIFK